jgi:DNA-binding Lrp family transcriptional regulator
VSSGYEGLFMASLERKRREEEERAQSGSAPAETARAETSAPPKGTSAPIRKAAAPVSAPPESTRAESGPKWVAYTHAFWDEIVPTLRPADAVVLGQLWRLTVGFNREQCTIGMPKLGQRCGLSRNPLREALQRLETRGLIRRVNVTNDVGNPDRGSVFEVNLARPVFARAEKARPESAPAASAPMIHDQKEDERPEVYRLREIAARFHHAYPDESHDARVERVVSSLVGQGRPVTREAVEEALRGLAL